MDDLAEKEDQGLFACAECGVSFIQYHNLLRHLEYGRHKIKPEVVNMYDYALELYRTGLEEMRDATMLQELDEALVDLTNGEDIEVLEEGWAIKKKRRTVRHSEKAKKFVEELFNLGASTGRKMDPAEAERLMIENDNILPSERMSAQQIRSYFSTLCRRRAKESARTKRDTEDDLCEVEDQLEDGEEEEAELLSKISRDVFDVVSDIVREHKHDLFDNADEPYMNADE